MILAILLFVAQPAATPAPAERALLDFRYDWPAEAEAIPGLRAELRRRRAAAHDEALAGARETSDSSRDAHVPFYTEMHHQSWSVEARNTRYLALTADVRTDQNGAHPNRDFEALIWDRRRNRPTSVRAVLGPAVLARLTPAFCSHLDAAVRMHGGEPPSPCPPFADQVLSFLDQDGNGRFETVHVLIPPYVAASYADGSFVVDVLLNRGDLAGVADREGLEETPGR
jgi:hypothetical protein